MDDLIRLQPGLSWIHESTECLYLKVVDVGAVAHALVKRGDDYEQITLRDLAREVVAAAWVMSPGLKESADDDWRVAMLGASERQVLLTKLRAVNEVKTGYATGYGDPGVAARPGFDPAATTLTSRERRKAQELGIDPRTLKRWRQAVDREGPAGLMHGNRRVSNELASFDDEEIRVAAALVAEEMTRSTKSLTNLLAILASRFREAGLEPLSAHRGKKILGELSRGQSLRGTAKTRRSKASRPKGGRGFTRPSAANEQWDIDSIRMDLLAYSPFDAKGVRVWGIVIIDSCTRITSIHLTPSPPSATSAAIALYKRINPLFLPDTSVSPELLLGIPQTLKFAEGLLAHPGGTPGEVHFDLGREYENQMFINLLARLGCDVVLARPRTGADKPTVESVNRSIAEVLQLFPGYKGNGTEHRGDHPERDRLLTLAQMQAIVDAWCAVRNHRPHTGLRHPTDLATLLTPAQMHVSSIMNGAPVRIPSQTNLIFQFLPVKMAAVTGTGPTINNVVYTTPIIETLNKISAGDRHVASRKLPFHYDPSDRSRVYWHEPGTAIWHVLHAVGTDGEALPPLSDALFDALLGQRAQRRPTKTDALNRASHLYDYIRETAQGREGRRIIRDEFNRFQERLTAPELLTHALPLNPQGAAASELSPPLFEFDFETYLDEVPDPEDA